MHPAALVTISAAMSASCLAIDCTGTSTGLPPLSEIGSGPYLGLFELGLYPDGRNTPPAAHHLSGLNRAASIVPRSFSGQPSSSGVYVLMSIGMSNTTQEFCGADPSGICRPWTFMGQAAASPETNTEHLRIVDGARGGQAVSEWDDPSDPNWDRVRDDVLAPDGLSEAQVQALWVKLAGRNPTQSLPSPDADVYALMAGVADTVRIARTRYPNLRQVFLSSRIYAGYADTALNPEPFAYESGFAVKWLIEAQIRQLATGQIDPVAGDLSPAVAPWLAWGPYLWADGLNPREGDGLVYECDDFQADGIHPGPDAEEKVGSMLLDFFLGSPYSAPWFARVGPCGAADLALPFGVLDLADVGAFVGGFTTQSPAADLAPPAGVFDLGDVSAFSESFVSGCP